MPLSSAPLLKAKSLVAIKNLKKLLLVPFRKRLSANICDTKVLPTPAEPWNERTKALDGFLSSRCPFIEDKRVFLTNGCP
ncbi:hypothetical protein BpHYR1_033160 [Brachionus plicatilis]|uniref:Uncharacterized protein n=1 Tax=Brachionus plicatilis TaxID=10195 RepID=A0A3M7QM87_BRAPC|nr:hypothetical protein BpHYR1_033160 [Brachionus plicatilis]